MKKKKKAKKNTLPVEVFRVLANRKFRLDFDGEGFVRAELPDGRATAWSAPSMATTVAIIGFVLGNTYTGRDYSGDRIVDKS